MVMQAALASEGPAATDRGGHRPVSPCDSAPRSTRAHLHLHQCGRGGHACDRTSAHWETISTVQGLHNVHHTMPHYTLLQLRNSHDCVIHAWLLGFYIGRSLQSGYMLCTMPHNSINYILPYLNMQHKTA